MRVLWFEVTVPSRFEEKRVPIGGWQDSLEEIVREIPEITLGIAFMNGTNFKYKNVEGVEYFPISNNCTLPDKFFKKYWDVYVENALKQASVIIDNFKPDVIHVFGTEYPFGQVQSITNVPVVIHIMGAIVPYNNAAYPPNYSSYEWLFHSWYKPKALISYLRSLRGSKNREEWERKTWRLVHNYMGRTQWDKSVANILHPGCKYFHVDEALRKVFLTGGKEWAGVNNTKLKLISTGCGTFWKGPDMMLKVARILVELGIDFEWKVAGKMRRDVKCFVERHEGIRFEDYNVEILGYLNPSELSQLMENSTIYVHTAYIENSPNSICEAQCIGIPVVSTNVGGISTLVNNGEDGILVPANDPWQMAYSILELSNNKDKMKVYSVKSRERALARHNTEKIKRELLDCYKKILEVSSN